jgi:lipid-binding SYLF domain-containing protein
MKLRNMVTVLGLTVALGLLQSGCVTNGGGGLSPSMTAQLDANATAALHSLYANTPAAKNLGRKAKAILIFPDILKGGFMFGGQIGNGVLRQHGHTVGYYNTVAASYGFQAGLQSFGYVMFLMNDAAVANLHNTGGWEVGMGPSIVVLDSGAAKSFTTTTVLSDVYAFVFNQTGLMAGVGLQGSKITEIQP